MTGELELDPALFRPMILAALQEDLGSVGDITTQSVVPPQTRASARIMARQEGVLAGIEVAREVFLTLDPNLDVQLEAHDGSAVTANQVLGKVSGSASSILTAERTALNFLGHLSGIATATHRLVEAVRGTNAKIIDTRKTTPGLRLLEKYAVRAGGGSNHRFGLYDAVLIKDNHLVAAGGISVALERVRSNVDSGTKVEVEVETLDQLEEALTAGAGFVLLDNMDPQTLSQAVKMCAGKAVTEASGGITIQNVRAVAETGVDLISVGWITHSAPNLDVALDFDLSKP